MVQIHGGGYTLGDSETAPGNALVYQSRGSLIYVAIQYRLGAYGFLGGPEVAAEGAPNVGLLDQRAALAWVQRHISKFGGDPAKVTIIGGSAGGGSVMNQMILYGGASSPPFRAAIAEYPWWQQHHSPSLLEQQFELLLNTSNCDDIRCLRSLSEKDLENAYVKANKLAYGKGYYGYGDFYYGPYVDGTVIRDLPSEEFKQGHFAKVPLLVNREGYEGVGFTNTSETNIAEEVADLQTLFPNAKKSFYNRLFELYPASDFNSTFFQRAKVFGDFVIDCPTYFMSTAVSDSGNPVYKLVFDAGSELHASLAPFLETVNLNGESNNATLGDILRSYYVSFANCLDPNAESFAKINRPFWPTYQNSQNGNFSVLNITYTTIGVSQDPDASPRCDFFSSQSYVVMN
ncbi:hypothetical protein N7474_007031 [Penicillium riverlandense]|uniref:uncharacterized protein n=1 Tax=Penicillium riverlandense TaxID=1903569 RepID=UPI002547133A|nr:uncharacterized protein N7474_007031 [Penicillium riverlandense]KAJ5815254.1 hypothetical protein N7474_007031 [Penicillium riverlandense]